MELNKEHIGHLENIAFGGLLRQVTPDEVANKLLERGYIRRAVGGLVITGAGHKALGKP